MSGRIVRQPKPQHHCAPGWHHGPNGFAHEDLRPVEGAIWECDDCGRQWRATYPWINVFSPTWRPVGRLRRWLFGSGR